MSNEAEVLRDLLLQMGPDAVSAITRWLNENPELACQAVGQCKVVRPWTAEGKRWPLGFEIDPCDVEQVAHVTSEVRRRVSSGGEYTRWLLSDPGPGLVCDTEIEALIEAERRLRESAEGWVLASPLSLVSSSAPPTPPSTGHRTMRYHERTVELHEVASNCMEYFHGCGLEHRMHVYQVDLLWPLNPDTCRFRMSRQYCRNDPQVLEAVVERDVPDEYISAVLDWYTRGGRPFHRVTDLGQAPLVTL